MPEVLIVSQPTWGVDAGAAAAIHQALVDLAARGSAIVVISQDLDELLALCDSLAVINEGRLSPKRAIGDVSHRGDRPADGRRARRGARRSRRHAPEATMLLELEKRKEPSRAMVYLTPVLAVVLTMVVGALVFSLARLRRRRRGLGDLRRAADRSAASWQDLGVKAAPLIMIARRPLDRLPRQCLEHRRRGPVRHRRRSPAPASRSPPGTSTAAGGCCR